MKRILLIVVLAGLGCSNAAFAEGNCPPGQYPIGGGGAVGCAPMPAGTSDLAPSGPRWADRWGAISIDGTAKEGGIGTVNGYPSKRSAEKAALAQCRASGGTKACKVNLSYYNQCGVIAWGDSYLTTQGGPTVEVASKIGLANCNQKTSNCTIYYSGCSLPERVR